MPTLLLVILIVLNFANIILHTIGAYLLLRIFKNGSETSHLMYLINLALYEALMNFLEVFRRLSEFISSGFVISEIQKYVLIVSFTGVSIVYYLNMLYITLDKLLDIALSLRYPAFWNEYKTIWLLRLLWFLSMCLCIFICFLHRFNHFNWEDAFFKYCYPILGLTFVVSASITYGFIFYKFKSTRTSWDNQNSTIKIFRNSCFYIPVLLILTFFLFMIIPDLTY